MKLSEAIRQLQSRIDRRSNTNTKMEVANEAEKWGRSKRSLLIEARSDQKLDKQIMGWMLSMLRADFGQVY